MRIKYDMKTTYYKGLDFHICINNMLREIKNFKCENQLDDEVITYFKTGRKSTQCYYDNNGKHNGELKEWNSNGKIDVQFHYKHGILDGEYKEWWENGHLYIQCYYKDNKLNGEYKQFYDSGKLYIQCYYKDNKQEGKYVKYNRDSTIARQGYYTNNENDEFRFYRSDKMYRCNKW